MRELFARSFSSVHVHYVPLYGYKTLGTSNIIMQQISRLAQRIQDDSARVQARRAEAWTRFDTRQLSLVVECAFTHLAKGAKEPFDFSKFRRRLLIPDTAEAHISEFLGHCLGDDVQRLDCTAAVLGSSILRRNLYTGGHGALLAPGTIFNEEMRGICTRAITDFLDHNLQCAFIDPSSSEKCVNSRIGHAAGHQSKAGKLLGPGAFDHVGFDSDRFISIVQKAIEYFMRTVDDKLKTPAGRREWRCLAAKEHRQSVSLLRLLEGFPDDRLRHVGGPGQPEGLWRDVSCTNLCYGCLFGRPEYALPCQHVLCVTCLEDFDETDPNQRYPGTFVHNECIICAASAATSEGWPHKAHVRPDLAGLRVLSLDGGGVRGIVELIALERLEQHIGLKIPIGRFFDFIIGTSAGKSGPFSPPPSTDV